MSLARIATLAAAAAALVCGQTFEVASLKPSGPHSQRGSEGGPGSKDPGRYTYNAANLDDLIAEAYHVDYFQISSKIALDKDLFDFTAKVPEGATREEFRAMLRNLLADRFHLKAHVEPRDFPGYELIVGKTGFHPREPASPDDFPTLPANRPGLIYRNSIGGGCILVRMRVQQQPMNRFAEALQQTPGRQPVVNKTDLGGGYGFTFEYSYDLPNSSADSAAQPCVLPDLFTALQQQLGLQLMSKKVPLDVVVVESFDRLPSEN